MVEVVAAQVGVTVGGFHLEHAVAELQDGDIEGAAAEVVDRDLHVLALLVETVGEGRGRRLVDDTLDLEAGDLARLLGGLALRVGEVGRHGDDRLGHLLAEVILGRLLHLLEDDGGDLLRGVEAAVDVDARGVVLAAGDLVRHAGDLAVHLVVGFAHETLDREDRVVRIGDGLALGGVAHLALAILSESDDGRRRARAFVIDDNGRLVAFHHGHAGIGGAQVDSDDFSHIQ